MDFPFGDMNVRPVGDRRFDLFTVVRSKSVAALRSGKYACIGNLNELGECTASTEYPFVNLGEKVHAGGSSFTNFSTRHASDIQDILDDFKPDFNALRSYATCVPPFRTRVCVYVVSKIYYCDSYVHPFGAETGKDMPTFADVRKVSFEFDRRGKLVSKKISKMR